MKRICVVLVALTIVMSVRRDACAAVEYTITELPTFGGEYDVVVSDINNVGQIVGYSHFSENNVFLSRAFIWNGSGPLRDLGTLGGTSSEAIAINDSGQIVGRSHAVDGQEHAFCTAPNSVINAATDDLGTLVGSDSSSAYSINSNGVIVGGSLVYYDNTSHSVIWQRNGPITTFGEFNCGSEAYSINDNGQVVGGASYDGFDSEYAFVYNSNGAAQQIPVTGYSKVVARANNSMGEIVGSATNGDGWVTGFYYEGNEVRYFNDCIPCDINDQGQMVGTLGRASQAFIWLGSGDLLDLNGMIDPASNWWLESAVAINDLGQIVGTGRNANGQPRAFLLTPVPEPSTLVLLGVVVAILLFCGLRRCIGLGRTWGGCSFLPFDP